MSDGNELARAFLDSVAGYAADPEGPTPSQDKPVKLGTVDPGFSGTGRPMVLFDGETLMGVKTYPWAGLPPRAGDRVVLLPQGRSYVIVGTLDTVPGSDIPVGSSIAGHWTTAPLGFLLEDGSVQLRATYPALFAVLGTRYNTGGETAAQFRLPDPRGRAAVTKAASGTFGTLGAKMGTETETLTAAQSGLPAHTHGSGNGNPFLTTGGSQPWVGSVPGFAYTDTTAANAAANASQAHNNIQPSFVFNRAVKY